MKDRLRGRKVSIYTKILLYVGASMLLVLICMELFCVLTVRLQQKNIEATYQNTVDFYADYWGTRLGLADQSLLVLLNSSCEEFYYATYGERTSLEYELAKRALRKDIEETGIVYSNQMLFFAYLPEQDLYVRSSYTGTSVAQVEKLEERIAENLKAGEIDYGRNWSLLDVGGEQYLYQIYLTRDGYCGALVDFSYILRGMEEIIDRGNYVTLLDSRGNDLIKTGRGNPRIWYPLTANLDMTDYHLAFMIERKSLYKELSFLTLLIVGITAVVIAVLIYSIRYQIKMLMVPLAHLNVCMQAFGQGNTQVRADSAQAAQEVKELLHSFNEMAEQITGLKISVYESELEQQKIRYNYLKVQIQPHFYTNVLNLIYGLAEVGKYEDIQKLSISMARYFRYLMDDKGDFVTLRRELECVNSYVEIQQLRYGGMIRFGLYALVDTDQEQLPPIVIQTFVENSIKYNVTMVQEIEVEVVVEKEEDMLMIRIRDNGGGFPTELLEQIGRKQDISVNGEHIGIRNVQMRIEALYGARAEMKLSNRTGGSGAEVCLKLPCRNP